MRNYRTKKQNLKQKGGAAAAAAQNHVNYENILLGSYDKLKSHYKDEMKIRRNNQVLAVNSFLISDKFNKDDLAALNAYKCNFYYYCNMYLWSLSSGTTSDTIIASLNKSAPKYFIDNLVAFTKILYRIIHRSFSYNSPIVVFRCFNLYGSENPKAKSSIEEYNIKIKTMKPFETIEFNSFMSTSGVNPLHNEAMGYSETNPTEFGYAVILIPSNTKFVMFERENEI